MYPKDLFLVFRYYNINNIHGNRLFLLSNSWKYCHLGMCGWLGKLKKHRNGGHVAWSVLNCYHSAPDLQMWTSISSEPVSFVAIIKICSFFLILYLLVCCSVIQLCLTLCDPMDCSMPGFPVLHYLPELTQTHVHWVGDAIQPSHPLSSPSPPALNLSHHQGLFQWVCSSHQVAKVLGLQLHHQSFQWIYRVDFLWDWLFDLLAVQGTLKSLLHHHNSKASTHWLALSLLYGPNLISIYDFWKNHSFDYMGLC